MLPSTNSVVNVLTTNVRAADRGTFSISVATDAIAELNETFTVSIRDELQREHGDLLSLSPTWPGCHLIPYTYGSAVTVTIRGDEIPRPSGLSATSEAPGEVTVSWDSATGGAAALIARYQSGFGPAGGASSQIAYSDIAGSGVATTSHTFTGLSGNVAYDFYIRAVASDGSAGAAATAPATALATTIGFDVANTSSTVTEGRDTSAAVCVSLADSMTLVKTPFSLSLRTTDGTAVAGDDYATTSVALGPFSATSRRDCTTVRITDDDQFERTETFHVAVATSGTFNEVVVAPSSLTITIQNDDTVDYSEDGRLIDVRTPGQLHAIRWDLNGDGVPDDPAYATSYSAAFPAPEPNMGCATTCTGYALARDVDLGASPFGRGGGGAGWLPIGAGNAGYDGDFDGRDYVVSGLYIHRPTLDHVGLFARIGAGATTERRIGNLGLINVDVTGNDYVGALAGRVSTDVVVSKVYVSSGSVVGNEGVGGLAGLIGDDVLAVYASVAVSGTDAVGGLAGISSGADARRLVASYAAGRVVGGGDTGGLVGRVAGITGTVASVYWDTFFSGQEASALGVGTDTRVLQEPTTYSGIYGTWDVDVDGDGASDDPWRFGTSFDYPLLSGTSAHVARQLLLQSQLFQVVLRVTGAATVAEGGVATYTVVASRAVLDPVPVVWSVGAAGADGAAADDFRADATTTLPLAAYPTGTATIRRGATQTTFSVYVLADEMPEEAEAYRVVVRVGDFGGNAVVGEASSAVATTIEFRGTNYSTSTATV